MVHSVSRWTRGVQVKLWDPLRTRAIPERLTGVFTTRRYTNPRLYLYLYLSPYNAHCLNYNFFTQFFDLGKVISELLWAAIFLHFHFHWTIPMLFFIFHDGNRAVLPIPVGFPWDPLGSTTGADPEGTVRGREWRGRGFETPKASRGWNGFQCFPSVTERLSLIRLS